MQKFLAGKFRPYYLPGPYDFRLSFRTDEQGRLAARTRGVAEDGGFGVRFGANTFIEGYDIATDVIAHAMNSMPLLVRILRHEPGGEKILEQLDDLVWQQIDAEKLPEWSLPHPPPPRTKKYYGDQ
jgi:hypothetical protein